MMRAKKFLKIIVDQSNRLINLVENMLSVTKLQNTKDNLIYKEVQVKPVVEMITSIVKISTGIRILISKSVIKFLLFLQIKINFSK